MNEPTRRSVVVEWSLRLTGAASFVLGSLLVIVALDEGEFLPLLFAFGSFQLWRMLIRRANALESRGDSVPG